MAWHKANKYYGMRKEDWQEYERKNKINLDDFGVKEYPAEMGEKPEKT